LPVDAVANWLSTNYPDLFVVFLLLGVGVFIGIMLYKFYGRLKSNEAGIEGVKEDVTVIKEDVAAIKDDITDMKLALTAFNPTLLFPLLSRRHSPLSLNDLGLRVFNNMRGRELLDSNKDYLFSLIDRRNPQTALDVEMAAKAAFLTAINEPFINSIKDYVYCAPPLPVRGESGEDHQANITLYDAFSVLGLPLRDMYLAEHPELLPDN